MTWNYRLVSVTIEGEDFIGLFEVYYEDGKPMGRTSDPVTFMGYGSLAEAQAEISIAYRDADSSPLLLDSEIGKS